MSSGALIAIVVVCVVVLLLVISGLIIFIVCRRRSLAMKPTTHTEREVIDEVEAMRQSGQGLPIDIPVQALHREPPPRYDETSTGRRRGAGSRQNASTASDTSAADISTISVLPPPPPYEERDTTGRASSSLSAPVIVAMSPYFVADADSGSVFRFDVPPPMYRSRPDLSGSTADLPSSPRAAMRAGSASTGRLRSVDSFMEFPSMSDILLTSSRSSLPAAVAAAAAGARDDGAGSTSPGAGRSDSARGDSLSSTPSTSSGFDAGHASLQQQQRSQSMSDIAVAHGGTSGGAHRSSRQQQHPTIPDSDLQRRARRAKGGSSRRAADQQNGGGGTEPAEARTTSDCAPDAEPRHRYSKQRRRSPGSEDGPDGTGRRVRKVPKQHGVSHVSLPMATVAEETQTVHIELELSNVVGSVV